MPKKPDETKRDAGGNPIAPCHDHVLAPTVGGRGLDLQVKASGGDSKAGGGKRAK